MSFLIFIFWYAAVWPLWRWWFARLWGGEPISYSVANWITVPILLILMRRRPDAKSPSPGALFAAALCLLAFTLSAPYLPMSIRALFAVAAGLLALQPRDRIQGRIALPLWALAISGIPSIQMLDLFFGYGLRLLATVLAAFSLQAAGLPILREEAQLAVNGSTVWVDAPCAGVHMLGTGLWLTLTLAQLHRFRWGQTLLASAAALLAVFLANTARIIILTLVIVFRGEPSPILHQMIGGSAMLLGTLIGATLTLLIARKGMDVQRLLKMKNEKIEMKNCGTAHSSFFISHFSFQKFVIRHSSFVIITSISLFFLSALFSALHPLLRAKAVGPSENDGVVADSAFPGWPETLEGSRLIEEPLTERERAFNAAFPGRIARFRKADIPGEIVILRWVRQPTHRVHSAANCLQSSGWQIDPQPLQRREDGDWSTFSATRNGTRLLVREQARDAHGTTFPDIPTWFWRALLNRTPGPWWVVTVTRQEENQE